MSVSSIGGPNQNPLNNSLSAADNKPDVEVGEGKGSTTGDTTTRTYDVKVGGQPYKVTIGYNAANLAKQYGLDTDAGGGLAKVIDTIVNQMDADSLIAMVGKTVQTSVDGSGDTKIFESEGAEKSLGDYTKSADTKQQALGQSIGKVVNAFQKSTVMESIQQAKAQQQSNVLLRSPGGKNTAAVKFEETTTDKQPPPLPPRTHNKLPSNPIPTTVQPVKTLPNYVPWEWNTL